ncbi:hypothetical protein PM082_014619 [Marasmius tenuissimus]|nr:hypothetical protein PM082_014619 [Marasmius tenuissimus]
MPPRISKYSHSGIPCGLYQQADRYVDYILSQTCPSRVRNHPVFRKQVEDPSFEEKSSWHQNLQKISGPLVPSTTSMTPREYREHTHYLSLVSKYGSEQAVLKYLDGDYEPEHIMRNLPPHVTVLRLNDRNPALYDHIFLTADGAIRVMLRYAAIFEGILNAYQDYAVATAITVINPTRVAKDSFGTHTPMGMHRKLQKPFINSPEGGDQLYFFTVYTQFWIKYRDLMTGEWRWTDMHMIPPKPVQQQEPVHPAVADLPDPPQDLPFPPRRCVKRQQDASSSSKRRHSDGDDKKREVEMKQMPPKAEVLVISDDSASEDRDDAEIRALKSQIAAVKARKRRRFENKDRRLSHTGDGDKKEVEVIYLSDE